MRTWFEFNDMAWETPEWRINQVSTATRLGTNLALTEGPEEGEVTDENNNVDDRDLLRLIDIDEWRRERGWQDKLSTTTKYRVQKRSPRFVRGKFRCLGSSLNIFSANLEYQEPRRQIIKREIFAFYKGFTKCHEMRRGEMRSAPSLAACQCLGRSFSNKLEF